jgi:hypothetical protein
MKNDISLIIKSKNQLCLSKYLIDKLAPIDYIRGFWVLNLFEPRFMVATDKAYKNLSRFTLNIYSDPNNYKKVYNKISEMLPNKDFMISYIAYTFNKFKSDIIVSILCSGSSTLNEIVEKYIKTLEGVEDIEITRITKTKRLTSIDEWRSLAGSVYKQSNGMIIEEQGTLEEDIMSGC